MKPREIDVKEITLYEHRGESYLTRGEALKAGAKRLLAEDLDQYVLNLVTGYANVETEDIVDQCREQIEAYYQYLDYLEEKHRSE